jgi:hypothetical protein
MLVCFGGSAGVSPQAVPPCRVWEVAQPGVGAGALGQLHPYNPSLLPTQGLPEHPQRQR